MVDWVNNPFVWINAILGIITVVGFLARLIFLFGRWKGKVDEAQSTFKTNLDSITKEIRADIDNIHTDVKEIFRRMGPVTATSESPIKLTDLGHEISVRLDAGAIADSLVPRVRARVSGMQPYEVQELCFEYMNGDEFVPTNDVNALILQCAFDKGLKRKQVLDVIAIELRDRLLQSREE